MVGWYRNATVFRERQTYKRGPYHVTTAESDGHLLRIEQRTLEIESGSTGRQGRFGHVPIWYAEKAYGFEIRQRVSELIDQAANQVFDPNELDVRIAAIGRLEGRPHGIESPWREQRELTVVARDPRVARWAKQQADGICDLCGSPAPFERPDGLPYLEVHHIKTLADGGKDIPANTVALCPNCHREAHLGSRAKAIRRRLSGKR